MMMKKKNFLFAITIGTLLFSLVACNPSNDNSGGSGESTTNHEHANDNSGGSGESTTDHEHSFSSSWNYDNTYHWHDATCGDHVVSNKEKHAFEDVVTPATYSAGGYTTHTCTVCGYSYTDSETSQLPITITWRNYDGSILEIDTNVPYGSMPHYDGREPSKKGDIDNIYIFSGWSPELVAVTCDTDYIATFVSETFSHVSSKTMTISRKENKPLDLDTFYATSTNNKSFNFNGSQLSSFTNGAFTIEKNGYVLNNDSINGIESINIVFNGSLVIQYGWLVDGKIKYSIFEGEILTSGINYSFRNGDNPSFVKIISSTTTYVTSIMFTFKDVLSFNRYESDEILCANSNDYVAYGYANEEAYVSSSWKKFPSQSLDVRIMHWYNGRPVTHFETAEYVVSYGYTSWGGTYTNSVNRTPLVEKANSLFIPNSITTIGDYCFFGMSGTICVEYTQDSLPNGFEKYWNIVLYDSAKKGTTGDIYYNQNSEILNHENGFRYTVDNNFAINIVGLTTSVPTNLIIPSEIAGSTNISISNKAFSGSSIKTVEISESVINIGSSAFEYCASLATVDLSQSTIPSVPSRCFSGCESLKNVILSDSVTSIGYGAFRGCISLEAFDFKNITEVDSEAFEYCISLAAVDLSQSTIPSVPSCCFSGCTSLKNVILSDSVTSIGYDAFKNCTSLEAFDFKNITEVGSNAFQDCASLATVDLSQSTIPSVPSRCFSGCESLKNVILSDSVTSIGYGAFCNCSSLESIIIPDSVLELDTDCFSGCTSLNLVVLGRNTNVKSYSSFESCPFLNDVLYYHGSVSDYMNITKGYSCKYVNYYLENEPTSEDLSLLPEGSLYWHYVNGAPTLW